MDTLHRLHSCVLKRRLTYLLNHQSNVKKEQEIPQKLLPRENTANLEAGQLMGNLTVIGVEATYTISIGGKPSVEHVIKLDAADVHQINGVTVSITNTTPAEGPPNMKISW